MSAGRSKEKVSIMASAGEGMGLTVRELIQKLSELPEHDKDLEAYIGMADNGRERLGPIDRIGRHHGLRIIVIREC